LAKRSRQDAVKQNTNHMLGLLQFDDRIEEMLSLTSDLDKFEAVVDDMRPRASTAIYSASLHACHMLHPYNTQKTDLRVLVLTDGQNNAGATPQEAVKEVQKIGAVVDAILVGDSPDENLRKIVTASGGTCFQIRSLSDWIHAMQKRLRLPQSKLLI
jgi:Mg-chelatase subunit ChlD